MTTAAETTTSEQEQRHHREGRAKRYARLFGGYALGYAGIGLGVVGSVAASPIAVPLTLGAGAGMLYASKGLMRPAYETPAMAESRREREPETWVRKLGRGAVFTMGMGINYIGAHLLGNALWPGRHSPLNAAGRVLTGAAGLALFMPGEILVQQSYNPDLYDPIDQPRAVSAHGPSAPERAPLAA